MKLRELMTQNVIRIHPEEPVEVAARTLTQYNIGALPVCGRDGQLYGMVTDRDLVIRCMAAGRSPSSMLIHSWDNQRIGFAISQGIVQYYLIFQYDTV